MEQKRYQEVVDECDKGIEKAREIGGIDYSKLAKTMQRKGNALVAMQKFDEGIEVL